MAISDSTRQTHTRLTEEFTATAELLRRSTVQVRSGRWGGGSGVIWRPDGLVVTNAHVVRGPAATVELWDNRTYDAQVIAADPRRDLAALRVAAADLPAAPIGNSDDLRVGQLVVAVGNPLGMVGAMTIGIVHAIAPAGRGHQPWVQADVKLAPGNSGGPLADVQGRVLGINSMIAGGLGLAVPSNAVKRLLQQVEQRPYLGLVLQPVAVRRHAQNIPGMLVMETEPGGPADQAGIILGDIVFGVGAQPFQTENDLGNALYSAGPGSVLHLDLLRAGTHIQRAVTVGTGAPPATGAPAEAA